MPFICHNGNFADAQSPVLPGTNPAFKWGEGLFETMKLLGGRILLADRHWARLLAGMQRLALNGAALQPPVVEQHLCALALRNGCTEAARLRLQVYRDGDGVGYIAEATPLEPEDLAWNERGWRMGVYPDARILPDAFSPLKRSSYLSYHLAGRYAATQGWDESLLLNVHDRLCDGARTNLFLVAGGMVYTPPVSEGCIAGVMRAHVLEVMKEMRRAFVETQLTQEMLLRADEIFLTNALKGIRWVRHFGQRQYGSSVSRVLYGQLQATF
ncbi:MAG: hypothetical protein EOO15_18890 [Chitinophagaceae bacterium]|nr:MAG: hypothetical protein EOO15_18890 [Chitinophagaceae bacterium]